MKIKPADFNDPQLRILLHLHLAGMRNSSPPEFSFALDVSGLQTPDISLLTVWQGDALMACGALKELSPISAEIKSMRTAPEHVRKGAAAFLLQELISLAQARGYRRLSLETGSGPIFDPALKLYERFGFKKGEAFAEYQPSEFNQFLHLDLG